MAPSRRAKIALGVVALMLLAITAYSAGMLYGEYNEAAHGGANRTQNSNASAAICFRVAKSRASKARDSLIAGITLNTLLLLFIVIVSFRCIELLNCIFCCCDLKDCLSERCRKACNALAAILVVGGLVTASVALHAVDASCKRLSTSLGLLIGSLAAFAVTVLAACTSGPRDQGETLKDGLMD